MKKLEKLHVNIFGETNAVNVHGEKVQKLDVFANEQFAAVLKHSPNCAGMASEEIVDFVAFDDSVSRNGKYVCMFDPLDGSSNIDVNVPVGSISEFSGVLLKRESRWG